MTRVVLTTATKLVDADIKKIKEKLAKKIAGELDFLMVVDPSVIGGLKISVNAKEIDNTVAGKLAQLKTQMLSALSKKA